MSIILTLEQKVVEDIVHVLKRLPFQPHFLTDLEAQHEAHLAPPVELSDAPVDNPVDIAPTVDPVVSVDAPSVG